MTKYITCKVDMSEISEWRCSNNCEDCVYYELNKKGGIREQVYEEMERIRNRGHHHDNRKHTKHITRNSNRRR